MYTAQKGKSALIDANNAYDYNIHVHADVSYVIIRGLTLKGAKKHGIFLDSGVNNIVIENNDISGWGTFDAEGWGVNYQAAVFATRGSSREPVERIIIQRNKMHHPRTDTNSWAEYFNKHNSYHPRGPQAISLFDSNGGHIIRYNEVYSDINHYFNDGFGGGSNASFAGFPNKDSDIYGNKLSHCWDDGIESEGANTNVRIWGNFIDHTYQKIAIASVSVGPLYIWRNVGLESLKSAIEPDTDLNERGAFIKAGGRTRDGVWYGNGRTYVFHNTVIQPQQPAGAQYRLGSGSGVVNQNDGLYELISRNNIYTTYKPWRTILDDDVDSCTNDWDYDLYMGKLGNNCSSRPHQSHGIHAANYDDIKFDPGNGLEEFALSSSSPGYDAGVQLPNFNDNAQGGGPDMGAFEAGSAPLVFGLQADWNTQLP